MTIELVRRALLWCAVINFGVLGLWGLLFLLPHKWMYQMAGRFFRLSAEQLDVISVAGMLLYKVGILLFNLVPYFALHIVG